MDNSKLIVRVYNLGWYWGHKAGSTGHDYTERGNQHTALAELAKIRKFDEQHTAEQRDALKEVREALKALVNTFPSDWYDRNTAKRTTEPSEFTEARKALVTLDRLFEQEGGER